MSERKALEDLLAQGKINRREFLSLTASLGIAAALPSILLSQTAFAAPKRGGTLKLGMGGGSTDDTLDPGTITDSVGSQVNYQIRNTLTEVAPNGDLVGDLAEGWEATPDAKQWTFKLRQGVEFHNGKSFEVADVIHSLRHHISEDSKSAVKGILEQIVDIKADGKHSVVMGLKAGNADFPYLLSDYHVTMFPDGEDPTKGTGTGPFVLESYEPGVRMMTTRNPNYYKEGLPYFDAVETIVIGDASARDNALKTGQVHVTNRVDQKTANLLGRTPNLKVLKVTGTKHYTMPMLVKEAPFGDPDVRMALKLSIDREALLQTVLGGHGVVGNDHPIGSSQPYYHNELEQRVYDPDKAKFHLKKAGMENLTVPLHAADTAFDGAVDAAVLVKEHASKAGITIDVVREPNDGYWSKVWQQKPWCMCYWSGRPTQDWMWATAYERGGSWNDTGWDDNRFQDLMVMARAELDEAKRKEMYFEMQQLCRDEGATPVPLFASDLMGISDKIAHPEQVASNWELDGEKCGERWWFA